MNVSPSFVSQIELGKANPSVGTLYAVVSVLGTTLDDLIGEPPGGSGPELVDASLADGASPGSWPPVDVPLQPAEGRKRVEMSGVGLGAAHRTTTTRTSTSCTSSTRPARRPARPSR